MSALSRLHILSITNPNWYNQITDFVKENPEFEKIIHLCSLTEFPVGFNKNPNENFNPNAPKNLFETIIYSIASSGVNLKYGYSQYLQIITYLREHNIFEENIIFPFKIQPKKVKIYQNLINILLQNDIIINEMTLEDLKLITDVKGIGITTISLCETFYGNVTSIPYTDRNWIKGFSKFYNIKNPTKTQILEKTNKWTNKRVGIMFINQCFSYY